MKPNPPSILLANQIERAANYIDKRQWKEAVDALDKLYIMTGGINAPSEWTELVYRVANLVEDIEHIFTP